MVSIKEIRKKTLKNSKIKKKTKKYKSDKLNHDVSRA